MPTARKRLASVKSPPIAAKLITPPRLNRVRRSRALAASTIGAENPVTTPPATVPAFDGAKGKKAKLRSRRFTIPAAEHAQLAAIKKRLVAVGVEIRKSELLRAGLKLLSALGDAPLKKVVATLESAGGKAGRNGKSRKRRL